MKKPGKQFESLAMPQATGKHGVYHKVHLRVSLREGILSSPLHLWMNPNIPHPLGKSAGSIISCLLPREHALESLYLHPSHTILGGWGISPLALELIQDESNI